MEGLFQDLRYGFRMLLKSRGFTVVAVIVLGLGIGANTAIFSVVDSVLLRPLPYEDPERIVAVFEDNPQKGWERASVAPANFIDWRDQNKVFEEIAAFQSFPFNLTSELEPERVSGARVSASLFSLLGVKPVLGRTFLFEEDQPGRDQVVVISHGLWQHRFGSDPNLVGKTLTLNTRQYTVIGVMPPDFEFPQESELWVPIAFNHDDRANRGGHYLSAVARLSGNTTLKQAQAQMDTIARRLQQQYPDPNTGWGVKLEPLLDMAVGNIRTALWVVLGAVAFVLLIACANVANLLLARAAGRQKEMAVWVTLGAGRLRIMRQLLTESLLLSSLGGTLGLLVAAWGIPLLVGLSPENIPRLHEVAIDYRALGFTLGVSLLTGIVFGLAPAFQTTKPDLNETLKEGGRTASVHVRQPVRSLLVVSEVGLALILLIGAGLLMKSFLRLQQVKAVFNPEGVLTLSISLPEARYSAPHQQALFFQQVIERIQVLPGVENAGAVMPLPLTGDWNYDIVIEGRPPEARGEDISSDYFAISPDYFHTMGIPLLKGRTFTERDAQQGPRVAIINETLARRYFPNEDPIGKRLQTTNQLMTLREVVGVVGDVKQHGLDTKTTAQVYEPYLQQPFSSMSLVVRTRGEPMDLTNAVRSQVLAVDKDQPVSDVRTMEEIVSRSVAQRRFTMLLLGIFAAVALLLAAIGLYGVMAYSVTQRTHEIGLRMALGAQASDVLKLVLTDGMVLALAGVAVGLSGAFALTRLISSLLYGVTANDPATFVAILLLLTAVALLASYIPARRATKVDPMVAVRYQ